MGGKKAPYDISLRQKGNADKRTGLDYLFRWGNFFFLNLIQTNCFNFFLLFLERDKVRLQLQMYFSIFQLNVRNL